MGTQILPWALEGLELGSNVLEVGPGYGVTSDLLHQRVEHLTCVEIDRSLAQRLCRRTEGLNVTVLCESATAMSLPDAAFDGAVCFTMLHPFRRPRCKTAYSLKSRAIRPEGVFAGTGGRYSRASGLVHLWDTMVIVDPATLPKRLESCGIHEH